MASETFLVDTSAWLFALRRDVYPEIKSRIDALLREDALFITGIIMLELLGGTRTLKEFSRLKSRLYALPYISMEEPSFWDLAFEMSFSLRRKGLTIPSTDILIASAAIKEDVILLHADIHFDHIARSSTLKVESFVGKV
jgi:predicted nucleic acid-binding protein